MDETREEAPIDQLPRLLNGRKPVPLHALCQGLVDHFTQLVIVLGRDVDEADVPFDLLPLFKQCMQSEA